MGEEEELLFSTALEALENSHSPYSNFQVASAVKMSNGKIYNGCNIENASYGATVCAERVAIWKAISEGAGRIESILVIVKTDSPWPPCGMCRQVIVEFADPSAEVIITNTAKKWKKMTVADICPSFFGPENLV